MPTVTDFSSLESIRKRFGVVAVRVTEPPPAIK
jgi:hypothetical protein